MRMPTEKQVKLIRDIELYLDVKFCGDTVSDATRFITNNMGDYNEARKIYFDLIYNVNNY